MRKARRAKFRQLKSVFASKRDTKVNTVLVCRVSVGVCQWNDEKGATATIRVTVVSQKCCEFHDDFRAKIIV